MRDPDRLRRAAGTLDEHEWLASADVYTIAATGELDAARRLLARDGSLASRVGGPFRWEPLLYLTYARLPLSAGRSPLAVARLFLEHGADPNAGYLWERDRGSVNIGESPVDPGFSKFLQNVI